MAGYGGQMLALDVETPNELQSGLAQLQQQQDASALSRATLPDKIAGSKTALSQANTNLDQSNENLSASRKTNQARSIAINQGLIANAASKATTPEEWDEAMQDLSNQGVPEAKQFVGRFSTQLQQRITHAYSAPSADSALEAMQSDNPTGMGQAESGLAAVAGGAGAGVTNGADVNAYDRQLAQKTPAELRELYGNLERTREAIQKVSQSQDPAATWDQEAQAMGHPDWVGQYSPERLQQFAQGIVPLDNYLRGRLTREGMGMPSPKIPAKVENVNGQAFSIDESDPSHPKATPLTPGKGNWSVFQTADGKPKMINSDSGEVRDAPAGIIAKIGGGRGGGAGGSVFQQKQDAWLHVHPGDAAGALEYASGRKSMQPADAMKAAQAQASRDLNAIAMAGGTVADPDAYMKQQAAAHYRELTQAAAPAGATSGGGNAAPTGQPPASALSMLQEGKPTTFKNGQVWVRKNGKPVRVR